MYLHKYLTLTKLSRDIFWEFLLILAGILCELLFILNITLLHRSGTHNLFLNLQFHGWLEDLRGHSDIIKCVFL